MSSVLPKSIDYRELPNSLSSNISSTTQILNPVNSKSTYSSNDIINFDFNSGNRGFIDPKSIYISYKVACTCGGASGDIFGVPVYAPFLRLDTIINGQTIESVNQYNQVCYMYVNCNTDVAGKAGVQFAYGYNGGTAALNAVANNTVNTDILLSPWDGRYVAINANDNYSVSAPIICNILTGCEKLIPSFLLPSIRMAFTIDQLANFTNSAAVGITAFTISNIQITYQLIDFGEEVQNMISSMPKFFIKSTGWNNSCVSIPLGTSGSQSIVYNQRFASIRFVTILPCGTNTTNLNFDFIDITNGGSYQISIGGHIFPAIGLNATNNKAAILQELRKCMGNLYNEANAMSINTIEFSYTDAACVTSLSQPGKFIVGIDCCKLGCGSSYNLLNGTSSQNSPINVLLNLTAATLAARNLNLVICYDALLEIDPQTRMLSAKI